MKAAMKAGDKVRLNTIRLLRSQLKDAQIAKRGELSPEEEIAVLMNAAKKRREAIEAYQRSDRTDLLDAEEAELRVIQEYLPEQLSEEEIAAEVEKVIADVGAASMRDMGRVMKEAMSRLKGRADGKTVQQIVRQKLSG
jgi:uncharacterized protein YqeY